MKSVVLCQSNGIWLSDLLHPRPGFVVLDWSDWLSGILCGSLENRAVEYCRILKIFFLLDIQNPVELEVSKKVGCSK